MTLQQVIDHLMPR